jgi:repressor LexA
MPLKSGESMVGGAIVDGDITIIVPQSTVENGEISAVLEEDVLTDATLNIGQATATLLTLKSANPKYRSLIFRRRGRQSVKIVGKYAGIIRRF